MKRYIAISELQILSLFPRQIEVTSPGLMDATRELMDETGEVVLVEVHDDGTYGVHRLENSEGIRDVIESYHGDMY